jgi:hypothetical protein
MANADFHPRVLERLKFRGRTVGQMKASCPRFNFLKTALADNSAPLDLDAAKSFYKNRESGINNSGTYACTIMVLKDEPELHIAPGRPDVEPFQVLRFK